MLEYQFADLFGTSGRQWLNQLCEVTDEQCDRLDRLRLRVILIELDRLERLQEVEAVEAAEHLRKAPGPLRSWFQRVSTKRRRTRRKTPSAESPLAKRPALYGSRLKGKMVKSDIACLATEQSEAIYQAIITQQQKGKDARPVWQPLAFAAPPPGVC